MQSFQQLHAFPLSAQGAARISNVCMWRIGQVSCIEDISDTMDLAGTVEVRCDAAPKIGANRS
jgi:hypothetical protein